jgi:hypothetical protein
MPDDIILVPYVVDGPTKQMLEEARAELSKGRVSPHRLPADSHLFISVRLGFQVAGQGVPGWLVSSELPTTIFNLSTTYGEPSKWSLILRANVLVGRHDVRAAFAVNYDSNSRTGSVVEPERFVHEYVTYTPEGIFFSGKKLM